MIDAGELARALDLHDRSYRLFQWLNHGFRAGKRNYEIVGETLAFADAARKWIRANRGSFPEAVRPKSDELDAFANHFISYLATSFEVVDRSRMNCGGCFCCGYWIETKHLRVRNPAKKAKGEAAALKRICVQALAEEAGRPRSNPEADAFIAGNADLADALSLVTYARELIRRGRFASQGEGVLVLWREISRNREGKRNKKPPLKSDLILEAERKLADRLLA